MTSAPHPALPPSRRFARGLAVALAALIWASYSALILLQGVQRFML